MDKATEQYDVIVIGAGPAGYIAAIRCAQLGLNTACIDDWSDKQGNHSLGGTYLNAGSIPSMALMQTAELYKTLHQESAKVGINVTGIELDVDTMIEHKDDVVDRLSSQIETLFEANRIHSIYGRGRILSVKRH